MSDQLGPSQQPSATDQDTPAPSGTSGPSASRTAGAPTPAPGWKFDWKYIAETAKNFKELILIVAFLTTGAVWVVNYFATQEQLQQVDCFAKLNVRMLQATAEANSGHQTARQARIELRDQERMLARLKTANTVDAEIKPTEARIDELKGDLEVLTKKVEAEKKAATRALTALTQNVCLIKDQRTKLMQQLAAGDF